MSSKETVIQLETFGSQIEIYRYRNCVMFILLVNFIKDAFGQSNSKGRPRYVPWVMWGTTNPAFGESPALVQDPFT